MECNEPMFYTTEMIRKKIEMEDFECKYCTCDTYYIEQKGPHLGQYCCKCGKFQKWIKQEQSIETGEVATEAQQKYALSLMTKWKHSGLPMTARQAGGIISLFK